MVDRNSNQISCRNLLPILLLMIGVSGLSGDAFGQPEASLKFESKFGKFGFYSQTFPPNAIPPNGFNDPAGVDWYTSDLLIIADQGNLKLQICSPEGVCDWLGNDAIFGRRNQQGTFNLPHGIEVHANGQIAVADENNHAVQSCDLVGLCIYGGDEDSMSNPPSSALGKWNSPGDVAFDSQNRIHGLDTGNNRIQVLRPGDLSFTKLYMSAGSALGQISQARGLTIDSEDRVIIADTGNHRIQICSSHMTSMSCVAFGSRGSGVGKFESPIGIDVDDLGRIWVADTGNDRIQVCDYQGACKAFGGPGTGNGQFDEPHDIAVHPSGQVAVADTANNRIQFFRTEAAFQINAGLNDAWFNPATPGQGFFITVFPGIEQMFIANFTFDTELPESLAQVQALAKAQSSAQANAQAILGYEGHRWLTGFGPFSGTQAVLDIELTSGGVFNSTEPAVTQTPGYGTFTVDFSSCSNGTITYEIPSLELTGVIPISRLAPDNVALCEALND